MRLQKANLQTSSCFERDVPALNHFCLSSESDLDKLGQCCGEECVCVRECVGGCGDLVKVVFTNTNLLMFNVQLEKRKKPWTCYADAHYSYAFILSAVWMWSVTHCAVYTHTHTNASRTALVFHSSVYFMCVLEIGRCFTGQIILQPNFHTAVNSHRKCVSSQSMELWSWTSTFFLYFTHLTPRWAGRYYYCTVL